MLKTLTSLFFLGIGIFSFGQDSSGYVWTLSEKYALSSDEVWSVDNLENFYYSDKGIINKRNKTGDITFSQSIKSLGRTTQIIPVNTMKLVHFSEEQQSLCYFDNTLTSMDDCIDLSDEEIVNATQVSASSQPNKLWVLDNLNSTLNLLSLDRMNQTQRVKNLRGILQIDRITQIVEKGSHLFLLDPQKGVYVFDLYGSLIEFFPEESIQQMTAFEGTLFTLRDNSITVRRLNSEDSFRLTLPVQGCFQLIYQNQYFYLRTDKYVHKYELQFSK